MTYEVLPPSHFLNGLGPLALVLLGGAGALGLIGALIPLVRGAGRARAGVVALALLGLLSVEGALLLVRVQSLPAPLGSPNAIRAVPRHPESRRLWALVALVGAPVLIGVGASSLWGRTRRVQAEELSYRFREGIKHYLHKDYDAALMEFTTVIKSAPERAEPYCKRGCVFERMGAHEMALADLERALARDPNLPDAYLHRGIVRSALGDHDQALDDFERVFALRSLDAECHLQRGICLSRKGAREEASAEFEKVLRMTNNPDYADPAFRHLRELRAATAALPAALPTRTGDE